MKKPALSSSRPYITALPPVNHNRGHTNFVRRGFHTISDEDLIRAIDMMKFDVGKTKIWVKTL